MTCEIIDVVPGMDGMGLEIPCKAEAVGSGEDGQRVCRKHGEEMIREQFTVTWDDRAEASPKGEG